MKTEYLLDTHILIWLITKDERLAPAIREQIEYYQATHHVSPMSLLEIVQLSQLGKLREPITTEIIKDVLDTFQIEIDNTTDIELKSLEQMPFVVINNDRHTDMVDRYLIAHAISHKYTMISSDRKFPEYRKYGLTLLEN